MDKFVPGSPCPYHGSYTKSVTARYRDQILGAGVGVGGAGAQVQAQARKMEPIWDIVSGLAKALTEARDQIATLMKHQQQQSGGFTPSDRATSPSSRTSHGLSQYAHNRCPPTNRVRSPHTNRNVHRSHAQGYCAFGRNTEHKEQMHNNDGGVRYSSPRYADQFQASGTGISRGGTGGSNDVEGNGRGGGYGIKLKGGGGDCGINVVPGSKSYTCRQIKGKKGIHLSAQMKDCHLKLDSNGNKFDGDNPVKIHITAPTKVRPPPAGGKPSPDVKRYCVGTQYANLLREESHHLRVQRSAVEPKPKKAHWNYF